MGISSTIIQMYQYFSLIFFRISCCWTHWYRYRWWCRCNS